MAVYFTLLNLEVTCSTSIAGIYENLYTNNSFSQFSQLKQDGNDEFKVVVK